MDTFVRPARVMPVYAARGMCATSNHLAAQAGLDAIKRGGNAFDAAIACASCLTVLEPQSNGVGGDAFALIWSGGKLYGLNASGYSGSGCTPEALQGLGLSAMPRYGFPSVTVPGAPSAWAAVNRRFGRLPLADVMSAAISYAEDGQAVSQSLSRSIGRFAGLLRENTGGTGAFAHWYETFCPDGNVPAAGAMFRNPGLAETLRTLANSGCEDFYRGGLAKRMAAFFSGNGGFINDADLRDYHPDWVDPISVHYRGYDVCEIPPNGQGLVALMALNILSGFEASRAGDPSCVHREIEALKLAFADGKRYIADPRFMEYSVSDLLSSAYAAQRRAEIGESAILPTCGKPSGSGTVYLCAADGEGNMISYIQSNYAGFGSGLVVPGTGIALQNRGLGFSLDSAMPGCAGPRKKPYHTIIPGFLMKDGQAVGPFGVMGGFMQPQGHLQTLLRVIDHGCDPQAALDTPRWQWTGDRKIEIEPSFPADIACDLRARGHELSVQNNLGEFGRGQMIFRTETGTLVGGTEPRCEGACAAW
ncbi:MAG: gamma-glutamyltransferase family protein [Clostridiaceae bacterium]|nr:gamma-glutamyltransferase family protein [Clostridiaceae bacterium]